jgi:hypothetical protein
LSRLPFEETVKALVEGLDKVNTPTRVDIVEALFRIATESKGLEKKISRSFKRLAEDADATVSALAKGKMEDLDLRRKQHELNDMRVRVAFSDAFSESGISFSTAEIPGSISDSDSIQLSVSAPRTVTPGRSFILDVWAHFESELPEIYRRATAAQREEATFLKSKGPVRIQRDTTLNVELDIPEFDVQQTDTIYWSGKIGNCTFPVKVPDAIEFGFYLGVARFYVGQLLIAKLNFDVEVDEQQKEPADLTTRMQKIRTAFASYASDDRNRVLGRIQGMLKLLPDLDIFLDVASLRSGENWENRLVNEIKVRDIFYLFWSDAASKSTWVEKEWRTALSTRGLSFIDPVPLESPDKVPPPRELASLHFNEWTLSFYRDRPAPTEME